MRKSLIVLTLLWMTAALCAQTANTAASAPAAVHAYALAELGWHAEAIRALESLHGGDGSGSALVQEQKFLEFSVQHTQACSNDNPCMAEDLLAAGRLPEALTAQKQQIKEIQAAQRAHLHKGEEHSGGNISVRLGDETDSTGGKLVALADAYDLQARIEAAMGRSGQALKSLDAAEKALPAGEKTAPRAAGYAYHRALILAEDHKFADAVKACDASMSTDPTDTVLGARRRQECAAITALASAL
jgi:tetratricopeptide (TPR) repeat protein